MHGVLNPSYLKIEIVCNVVSIVIKHSESCEIRMVHVMDLAFDVTHEFWGGNFKNGITSPS